MDTDEFGMGGQFLELEEKYIGAGTVVQRVNTLA